MTIRNGGRWHWWVILLAGLFPSFITWLYFDVLPGVAATTILYGANKIGELVFPLFWVCAVLRQSPRFGKPGLRGLAAGAATGAVMLAGILGLYFGYLRESRYLEGVSGSVFAKLGDLQAATPMRFAAFGFFLIFLNSAIEEYYWRWFIFGRLRSMGSLWMAVTLSSATFMLHHVVVLGSFLRPEYFWTAALFFSVCVAAGGAVWAWQYHRTGSVFVPWLSHLIADAAVIVIGIDILRGQWV